MPKEDKCNYALFWLCFIFVVSPLPSSDSNQNVTGGLVSWPPRQPFLPMADKSNTDAFLLSLCFIPLPMSGFLKILLCKMQEIHYELGNRYNSVVALVCLRQELR